MTTNTASPAVADETVQHHLGQLAQRLGRAGWFARVSTSSNQRPILHVVNPASSALSELVSARPGPDGTWSFWFSWGEPLASVHDLDVAALRISCVLAVLGE